MNDVWCCGNTDVERMAGFLGSLNERVLIYSWPSRNRVGEWLCEYLLVEIGFISLECEDMH